MAKKFNCCDENAPAWARYNGETYKSDFSGTPEQKKEHNKAVAALFSKSKNASRRVRRNRKSPLTVDQMQ